MYNWIAMTLNVKCLDDTYMINSSISLGCTGKKESFFYTTVPETLKHLNLYFNACWSVKTSRNTARVNIVEKIYWKRKGEA